MRLTLTGGRPITTLEIDLLGDGLPAPTQIHADDLRDIAAVRFRPARAGRFELQVRVTDAAGCTGATTVRRVIDVGPHR